MKDLKSVSPHASLTELGMDSMMAVEMKQTLEREFEIFMTAQDIRTLNFAKLQEMSAKDADSKNRGDDSGNRDKTVTGMKLVRLIGEDDINPNTCLKLKTKETGKKARAYLVPGIEGVANVFSELAPKLEMPAYCLQLGQDDAQDSAIAIADRLVSVSVRIFIMSSKNESQVWVWWANEID